MGELSQEQEFVLAAIGVEAAGMARQELIDALVSCWTQKFELHNIYQAVLAEHEISFRMQELKPLEINSDQMLNSIETEELIEDVMESATMDLDMDAIVLSED